MARFTPPYPLARDKRGKLAALLELPIMFWRSRRSMLSVLSPKAYAIKLAELKGINEKIIVPVAPRFWKQVLVGEPDKFPKSRVLFDILNLLTGDSILVSNGDVWSRQRRMINPVFEAGRIKHAFGFMQDAVEKMVGRLDRIPLNASADIEAEMSHVTSDIIFRAIFSEPISDATLRRFSAALAACQDEGFAEGVDRYAGVPPWLTFRRRRRLRRAVKEVRDILDGLVRRRIDSREPREDMLQALIDAVDPVTGTRFSFEEICEEVAVLFLAGHETSATVLSWSFYLLAMDQEIQERLRQEADVVLGGRPPKVSDLRKLSLARNIFNETLRLYPPVAFLARTAAMPCAIGGKPLAAGHAVMVSPWLIQRSTLLWPDSHVFDPDRFDRPETAQCQRDGYIPFGRGPRACVGASFAVQEATLILATLARRYRFDPIPGFTPQPIARATVRSANGIKLRVARR